PPSLELEIWAWRNFGKEGCVAPIVRPMHALGTGNRFAKRASAKSASEPAAALNIAPRCDPLLRCAIRLVGLVRAMEAEYAAVGCKERIPQTGPRQRAEEALAASDRQGPV